MSQALPGYSGVENVRDYYDCEQCQMRKRNSYANGLLPGMLMRSFRLSLTLWITGTLIGIHITGRRSPKNSSVSMLVASALHGNM